MHRVHRILVFEGFIYLFIFFGIKKLKFGKNFRNPFFHMHKDMDITLL